jgi:hypothetical protein
MVSEISNAFLTAKRNCFLCHSYRNFRETEPQREMARTSTRRAYDLLRVAFDEMRTNDAPLQQLDTVRAAKVLSLDALEACDTCDKQRPRIKEILIDVK